MADPIIAVFKLCYSPPNANSPPFCPFIRSSAVYGHKGCMETPLRTTLRSSNALARAMIVAAGQKRDSKWLLLILSLAKLKVHFSSPEKQEIAQSKISELELQIQGQTFAMF